jgi:hypothetical protein
MELNRNRPLGLILDEELLLLLLLFYVSHGLNFSFFFQKRWITSQQFTGDSGSCADGMHQVIPVV